MNSLVLIAKLGAPGIFRGYVPGQERPVEGSALELVAIVPPSMPTVLLLTSLDCALTTCRPPQTSRRMLDRVIPYAMEDDLVDDIDDLEFRIGPTVADGEYAVSYIGRERLSAWIKELTNAGFNNVACVPYVVTLPKPAPGMWQVFFDGEMVTVRTDTCAGFSVPLDQFDAFRERAVAEFEGEPHIEMARLREVDPMPTFEADRIVSITEWLDVNSPLVSALTFKPSHENHGRRVARQTALAAALLVMALLVHAGFLYRELGALDAELMNVRNVTAEAIKSGFPEISRVVNPRVQIEQTMNALAASQPRGASFLDALYASGEALQSLRDTRMTALRYQAGTLDLTVQAIDIAALEQLATTLNDYNLEGQIVSAESGGSGITGRLRVSAR